MSIDGTWNLTLTTPMGPQQSTLALQANGSELSGTMNGAQGVREIENGKVDGDSASWSVNAVQLGIVLEFRATVDGDNIAGEAVLGAFGTAPFAGTRA